MKKAYINPPVPEELKVLVEDATTALRMHTGEGKAIVLTLLRERFDETIKEIRAKGFDQGEPDEADMKKMAEAVGEDAARAVNGIVFGRGYWGLQVAIRATRNTLYPKLIRERLKLLPPNFPQEPTRPRS